MKTLSSKNEQRTTSPITTKKPINLSKNNQVTTPWGSNGPPPLWQIRSVAIPQNIRSSINGTGYPGSSVLGAGIVGNAVKNAAVKEAEDIITDAMIKEMLEEAEGILAKNAAKQIAKETAAKSAASISAKTVGKATGLFATLLDFITLSGDSDQRWLEQYKQYQDIAKQENQRIKTDTNIKLTYDEKGRIVIYRWGGATLNTLTPTPGKDAPVNGQSSTDFLKAKGTIGMSWSLVKPAPGTRYVQTTLDQVNQQRSCCNP